MNSGTNLIESLGYSLGKVHVGLLAYMWDIYRAGQTGPLAAFMQCLDLPVPKSPFPVREWKAAPGARLDLAIFDGPSDAPGFVFELKVDDHEKICNGNTHQTTYYADATPQVPHRLFVTIGNGEYFHAPYDERFRWLRLSQFSEAIQRSFSASHENMVIRDWALALDGELDRREAVQMNERGSLSSYRPGSWNITFLGELKEMLYPVLDDGHIDVDPTCYTYGTRPDTILNFGWSQYPRYAEINNNGRLNVKITFEDCEDDGSRQSLFHDTEQLLLRELGIGSKDIHAYNGGSSTMTISSLDIGLDVEGGGLQYRETKEHTTKSLIGYLKKLYDSGNWRCQENGLI